MNIDVLWDRLAGCFKLYVENYELKKYGSTFNLKPSYEVDYEIDLDVLKKYTDDIDNYWAHLIGGCRNINNLPNDLKELVLQFLPRFFEQFPQYKEAECLKSE